jgi:hypothetical protein
MTRPTPLQTFWLAYAVVLLIAFVWASRLATGDGGES